MDNYELLIQEKLDTFFKKKATELNLSIDNLGLMIANSPGLTYNLYNDKKHIDHERLSNILNIGALQMIVAKVKVESMINNAISKIAAEEGCDKKDIQLLLKSNKTYFALKNRTFLKQIKLNEIL